MLIQMAKIDLDCGLKGTILNLWVERGVFIVCLILLVIKTPHICVMGSIGFTIKIIGSVFLSFSFLSFFFFFFQLD